MIPPNKKHSAFLAAIFLAGLPSFVRCDEGGSIRVNPMAFDHARELIRENRVIHDRKGSWGLHRPSRVTENEFVRLQGFEEYGKWHLGIDSRHSTRSKAYYKFPFGDFNALHRCALLAVKARAHEYGYAEIEVAADQLLKEIALNRTTH